MSARQPGPRTQVDRVIGARLIKRRSSREAGMLTMELIVALAILAVAAVPLALSFRQESKLLRQSSQKAAAMELIDGELEILLAGEWRAFHEGSQPYELRCDSAKILEPGKAVLTIAGKHVRLEWLPDQDKSSCRIVREGVAR